MIRKFASFEVLEATLAPMNDPLGLHRYAHRHSFTYEPRPGYLYVRSRAISSRCNDNFDEFPAEEIKQGYRTFIGKPVFVNHNNDNHRRARGVIIDAALHEDRNPDGTPDVWSEVLMEVDAIRFPRLAKAILAGHIDRTSMGTDVAFSVCSVCNNKATNPLEYCAHIPKMKGQRIYRTTASGRREGILVREICHGLKFFENSLLVEEPADPTAFFLGVDDHSGLASVARKVAHGDHYEADHGPISEGGDYSVTHRHRPSSGGSIPTTGTQIAGLGCPHCGWAGFTEDARDEHMYEHHPDRPDTGQAEIDLIKRLRGESRRTAHQYHEDLQRAPGETYPHAHDGGPDNPYEYEAGLGCPHCEGAFLNEGERTNHIRSAHPGEYSGPDAEMQFLKDRMREGAKVAHGDHEDIQDGHMHLDEQTRQDLLDASSAGKMYAEMQAEHQRTPANLNDRTELLHHMLTAHEGHSSLEHYTHDELAEEHDDEHDQYHEDWPNAVNMGGHHFHEATRKHAYGETMAPADVDTLRDEECPVCGEADAYDGNECQVCGFVAPPKMFQDPNLDTAKSMDLRKDVMEGNDTDPNGDGMPDVIPGSGQPGTDEIPMNANEIADPQDAAQDQVDQITDEQQPLQPGEIADDGQPVDDGQSEDADAEAQTLTCPACGFTAPAAPPETTPTDAEGATPDGLVAGDVCPQCAAAQLVSEGDLAQPEQTNEAVPVGQATSAMKGQKDSHADRRAGITQKEQSMRPVLAAVEAQQRTIQAQAARIATLEAQVGFIARVAGVTQHVTALKVEADVNNPAQPIPDPPSEGAFETTEQAATPSAMDSPLNPGMTPGSVNNLAADTTTTPLEPGVTLDTPPFNELQNVQAPIAGTETQRPLDETKIETDVRVGDPMNLQTAFPWTLSSLSSDERAARTMASLRLAKLRREAGLSNEDELGLAEKIASDESMLPQVIENEISTLSAVTRVAARQRPAGRPGGLVPRAASSGVQRTVPSLSAEAGLAAQAGGGSVSEDTADSDLFD